MATTYGLDLSRALRSIRQRKAAGGYVPQGFINDILEANINQAAGGARSERALSLQEEAQKTAKENAARSLALSEANAKTQKEQFATSLEEQKRRDDLNRALTEEQIANQGKSSIASMVTQVPLSIWAGKQAYDWLFPKTLPPTPPATPSSITGPSPLTQPDSFNVDQSLSPENIGGQTPSWLKDESAQPSGRMFLDQTAQPEMYDTGTPTGGGGMDVMDGINSPSATTEAATINRESPSAFAPNTPTATATGPTAGGAAGVAAIIKAASMARNKWGELDKDYSERGPLGKFTSTPVTGGVPALLDTAGVGDSNYFAKSTGELAKGEEDLVGKPLDTAWGALDKTLSGDFGGGLKDVGQSFVEFGEGLYRAPERLWKSVTGGGK